MPGSDYFNIYKKWNIHERDLRKIRGYGNVWFVDREYGSNSNSGRLPTQAFQDINTAVAECRDNYGDIVVFKGRLTGGQAFTEAQILNVAGMHLIGAGTFFGMGGMRDSCFVSMNTADGDSDYGDHASLIVGADSIEVTGLKFYTADPAQAQYHIGCFDMDGSYNCRDFSIHDNVFQGMNAGTASRQSGIKLLGTETGVVYRNMFYYCEHAIELSSGSRRYCNGVQIMDNYIRGSKYGIYLSGTSVTENFITDNVILGKTLYGYAMTNGVHVIDGVSGNIFARNFVDNRTLATAFRKGSGTNTWILNYVAGDGAAGVGGGTLYAET